MPPVTPRACASGPTGPGPGRPPAVPAPPGERPGQTWTVEDCERAAHFYVTVFHGTEVCRTHLADGRLDAVEVIVLGLHVRLARGEVPPDAAASGPVVGDLAPLLAGRSSGELIHRAIDAGGRVELVFSEQPPARVRRATVVDCTGRRWRLGGATPPPPG